MAILSKSLVVTRWLTGTSFVLLLLWGYASGDLLGYFSFALLSSAVLINISNILGIIAGEREERFSKITWITLAIVVLLSSLVTLSLKEAQDIWTPFLWAMVILAFPASLLVTFLLGLGFYYLSTFSIAIPTNHYILFLTWASLFAIGYFQWFRLARSVMDKCFSRLVSQESPTDSASRQRPQA